MRWTAWFCLATVVMTCGCKESLPPKLSPGQAVSVRGELAPGAECPMLIVSGSRRLSIAGDLGRFRPGDQVCVKGHVAEISYCMAGEATIRLDQIAPADSCP